MTKNENGYPINTASCAVQIPAGCGCTESGDGDTVKNGCGGSGNFLDSLALAYVYAPDQKFRMLYSAKDALSHGTLFEELYKPMEVYGHE